MPGGRRNSKIQTAQDMTREYTLTLNIRLSEPDHDLDALLERLAEVGCTDALVGIGKPGRLALDLQSNRRDGPPQ